MFFLLRRGSSNGRKSVINLICWWWWCVIIWYIACIHYNMCITTICCWIWWRQRTIYIDRRLHKSRVYVYFNVIYLQFQLHFLVTSFCKFTKNWSEYWIFYYVIYYVYGLQQPTSTFKLLPICAMGQGNSLWRTCNTSSWPNCC